MTKPIPGRPAGSPQPAGCRPSSRPARGAALGLGLAAVGLMALAACGSPATTDTAASGPAGSSSSALPVTPPMSSLPPVTSTVVPPPGSGTTPVPVSPPVQATGSTVPPSQVDYSGAAENVPRTVWQQDDGRTLVVMAEQGGCVKVDAQVTKQTSTEVDITLLSIAETHRVCPQYIRNVPVAAHLDAPLGSRKVVLTTQTGTQH